LYRHQNAGRNRANYETSYRAYVMVDNIGGTKLALVSMTSKLPERKARTSGLPGDTPTTPHVCQYHCDG